jgi:hypothetical protein
MRKALLTLLCLTLTTSAFGQESREARMCRRGQNPGYTSRDATVVSMMGWGVGLAIGIAALCALIDNNKGSATTTQ